MIENEEEVVVVGVRGGVRGVFAWRSVSNHQNGENPDPALHFRICKDDMYMKQKQKVFCMVRPMPGDIANS